MIVLGFFRGFFMNNKLFILVSISCMPLLSQAASNLDQIKDLKSWFDGTIEKASQKNSDIAEQQIQNSAELAKMKGLDPDYVNHMVRKVFHARASTVGAAYWKNLFDQTMKKALQRSQNQYLITDQLILNTAELVKAEGLDQAYVDRMVRDVLHKRENIEIEHLKKWFLGTIKKALDKNENDTYTITDKQIKTTAQKAKAQGLEAEYVDYIVDQILRARKNNITIQHLKNWFDGTIGASLEKRGNTWVIADKQIQSSADLVKALGLDSEYVDRLVDETLYTRALDNAQPMIPSGSNLAIPVGKSYTDEALVSVGPSEMMHIAQPSLAVPYGSNLATPVGKSYANEALVPVGSSALLSAEEKTKALMPMQEKDQELQPFMQGQKSLSA